MVKEIINKLEEVGMLEWIYYIRLEDLLKGYV